MKQEWFDETELVYHQVLHQLTLNLNSIHNSQFEIGFWNSYLGSWLQEFVDMVMLRFFEIAEGATLQRTTTHFEPAASLSEYRKFAKMHHFTEKLHEDLLRCNQIEPIRVTSITAKPSRSLKKSNLSGYFISASYLPRLHELLICLRFGHFPRRLTIESVPPSEINQEWRSIVTHSGTELSRKSKTVLLLMERYLPRVYLESFPKMIHTKRPWKSKRFPKVIFTSNRHIYDDVFNYWAATAKLHGTKIVYGQHGGFYGISEFPSFAERMEIMNSDRHINWGWKSDLKSIPGPVLPLIRTKILDRQDAGSLTIVTDQLFVHSRSIFGDIQFSSSYLPNIRLLVDDLTINKQSVLIRLPKTHSESSDPQDTWFRINLPDVQLDLGGEKFHKILSRTKLAVIPHNGTTLIESIYFGVPTLLVWDKSIVWFRPEAEPVFQLMERAGMFHSTPESAAAFINRIWDDVDGWWNSPQVIDARSQFCNQYARTVPHPVRFLAKALKF
jgi:putative transferase (TIGR04331 family)